MEITNVFLKETIAKEAEAAAQHFCSKMCLAPYACGKPKGEGPFKSAPMRMAGKNPVCPLAKYGVESWESKDMFDSRGEITMEECTYLCLNCEYSESYTDGDDIVVDREKCFRDICIDCPVCSAMDIIQEAEAEARMS